MSRQVWNTWTAPSKRRFVSPEAWRKEKSSRRRRRTIILPLWRGPRVHGRAKKYPETWSGSVTPYSCSAATDDTSQEYGARREANIPRHDERPILCDRQIFPARSKWFTYPSKAILPRHTTTRRRFRFAISSSTNAEQFRISIGKGLFPGGAHRTTDVMWRSLSRIPSSRDCAVGCDANPVSNNTGYRKFPDPSPVNGRPVRLEPCAPGASPSARTRASGSPNEGTGFPQ